MLSRSKLSGREDGVDRREAIVAVAALDGLVSELSNACCECGVEPALGETITDQISKSYREHVPSTDAFGNLQFDFRTNLAPFAVR